MSQLMLIQGVISCWILIRLFICAHCFLVILLQSLSLSQQLPMYTVWQGRKDDNEH